MKRQWIGRGSALALAVYAYGGARHQAGGHEHLQLAASEAADGGAGSGGTDGGR